MAQGLASDQLLLLLIPEVSCVDEQIRVEYLDLAADMVNFELFGKRSSQAHAFLAGHWLALTRPGLSNRSPTTSKSIGGALSATYAVATPKGDEELSSTAWGLAYLAIRNSVVCNVGIVGGPC